MSGNPEYRGNTATVSHFSVCDNVVKSVYETHAAAAVFDSHIAMHSFVRHQGVLYYTYLSLVVFSHCLT